MTELQRHVMLVVGRATVAGAWYRAASSGQRVTLASLYRAGLLKRRAWRGVEGEPDAAHEYQLSDKMIAVVKEQADGQ